VTDQTNETEQREPSHSWFFCPVLGQEHAHRCTVVKSHTTHECRCGATWTLDGWGGPLKISLTLSDGRRFTVSDGEWVTESDGDKVTQSDVTQGDSGSWGGGGVTESETGPATHGRPDPPLNTEREDLSAFPQVRAISVPADTDTELPDGAREVDHGPTSTESDDHSEPSPAVSPTEGEQTTAAIPTTDREVVDHLSTAFRKISWVHHSLFVAERDPETDDVKRALMIAMDRMAGSIAVLSNRIRETARVQAMLFAGKPLVYNESSDPPDNVIPTPRPNPLLLNEVEREKLWRTLDKYMNPKPDKGFRHKDFVHAEFGRPAQCPASTGIPVESKACPDIRTGAHRCQNPSKTHAHHRCRCSHQWYAITAPLPKSQDDYVRAEIAPFVEVLPPVLDALHDAGFQLVVNTDTGRVAVERFLPPARPTCVDYWHRKTSDRDPQCPTCGASPKSDRDEIAATPTAEPMSDANGLERRVEAAEKRFSRLAGEVGTLVEWVGRIDTAQGRHVHGIDDGVREELKTLNNLIASVNERVARGERTVEGLAADIRKELGDHYEALQRDVMALEKRSVVAGRTLGTLTNNLGELRRNITDNAVKAKDELNALARVVDGRTAHVATQRDVQVVSNETGHRLTQLESSLIDSNSIRNRFTALQDELRAAASEFNSAAAAFAANRKRVDELDARTERQADGIAAAHERLNSLVSQLDQLGNAYAATFPDEFTPSDEVGELIERYERGGFTPQEFKQALRRLHARLAHYEELPNSTSGTSDATVTE